MIHLFFQLYLFPVDSVSLLQLEIHTLTQWVKLNKEELGRIIAWALVDNPETVSVREIL